MRQVILYASMYDTWENNPIGWFCLRVQFFFYFKCILVCVYFSYQVCL